MKHFFVLNTAFFAVFSNFYILGNTFWELCYEKPCIPTHLKRTDQRLKGEGLAASSALELRSVEMWETVLVNRVVSLPTCSCAACPKPSVHWIGGVISKTFVPCQGGGWLSRVSALTRSKSFHERSCYFSSSPLHEILPAIQQDFR